jgi:hypothetical protein
MKIYKDFKWVGEEVIADINIGEVRKGNLFPTEVAKIHHTFFFEPKRKQRAVLRLLIWWALKQYVKTIKKK